MGAQVPPPLSLCVASIYLRVLAECRNCCVILGLRVVWSQVHNKYRCADGNLIWSISAIHKDSYILTF